jgi:hypothetical protein
MPWLEIFLVIMGMEEGKTRQGLFLQEEEGGQEEQEEEEESMVLGRNRPVDQSARANKTAIL